MKLLWRMTIWRMTMSDNLAPIITELRRAFGVIASERFGKVFPDKEMPSCVVNIPHKDTRRVGLSWFTPDRWKSETAEALAIFAGSDVESMNEICIAAEALRETDTEILAMLTHEMVHHFCNSNGIADTSGHHYHNGVFVNYAGLVGLDVTTDNTGHVTNQRPTAALSKVFATIALDKVVFDLYRKTISQSARPGSKLKKWQCAGQCTTVRVARYLEATCDVCGTRFEYVDKDAKSPEVKLWLASEAARMNARRAYLQGNGSYGNPAA